MGEIKVSVIMAVYNAEKYLRQALDTVVNQTLREIEIILVDDMSTDESYSIMQEYAKSDNRIRLVQHTEKTYSAAAARNMGIELARGRYLSILDGDDFFELDMLKKTYQKGVDTDADLVIFDGFLYQESRGKKEMPNWLLARDLLPKKEVFTPKECGKDVFSIKGGMAWNSLIKRDFLISNGIRFFEVYHAQDDWVFTYLSIALADKIAVVPERLLNWRRGIVGSQSIVGEGYPEGAYLIVTVLMNELKKRGRYEEFRIALANRAMIQGEGKMLVAKTFSLFDEIHSALKKKFVDFGVDKLEPSQFANSNFLIWRDAVLHGSSRDLIDKWYLPRKLGKEAQTLLRGLPWGKRFVIYGANEKGKKVFKWLMGWKWCEVVNWVDREYEKVGFSVKNSESLRTEEFDYIVVAVETYEIFESIRAYLNDMGISKERVIWLFRNVWKGQTTGAQQMPSCKTAWSVIGGNSVKTKMYIYGAGDHLFDMLDWHPDLSGHIARIFDKDKNKIGKDLLGIGRRIESPFEMWSLPQGTRIVISALRYYDEIVRDIKKINPGLVCLDIDKAYEELKRGKVASLPQSKPIKKAVSLSTPDLFRQKGRAAQARWRQRFAMECCSCRHVWWGVRGLRADVLRRQFLPMMVQGDIFIDEDDALRGKLVEGLPVCVPDALKDVTGKYRIIVLVEGYERVRDLLAGYGFVENVDFVEGRRLIGEDENGYFEEQSPAVESTIVHGKGMLVYGEGAHLADMLDWHPELSAHISRVFDKDAKKWGKTAQGLSAVIESPEVLRQLPAGTQIAISAIRYFEEISKEIYAINPGLDCRNIDDVWMGYV